MIPPIPERPALFIDVDGTLIPLAERPDDAHPDAALLQELGALHRALEGAVALLSGRTLANLDQWFGALQLPSAGTHGLERRRSDGVTATAPVDPKLLDHARHSIARLVRRDPRLHVEDKGIVIAVHYRAAPEQHDLVMTVLHDLASELGGGFHLQPGHSVIELKPRRFDKGTALADFMAEPAFRGRVPVAIGDDLTDLDAFRAAERLGGFGVVVGDRVAGRWNFPRPRALRDWLALVASEGMRAN
jgi:trehalose 6-phosphate phosphatase